MTLRRRAISPGGRGSVPFGTRWAVVAIQAGISRNRRLYFPEVLESAVPLFVGAPVHLEHASEMLSRRDPAEVVGHVEAARFDIFTDSLGRRWPQVVAEVAIGDQGVREGLLAWRQRRRGRLGVSAVMRIEADPLRWSAADAWECVRRIVRVDALDLTASPAAGGRVLGVVTGRPRPLHGRAGQVYQSVPLNQTNTVQTKEITRMSAPSQPNHMNDLASRLPSPLGDTLRAAGAPPTPPAESPRAGEQSPGRFLTFGPQAPSAGGGQE